VVEAQAREGGRRHTGFIWFWIFPRSWLRVMVEARTSLWDPYVGVTNNMNDYTRLKVACIESLSRKGCLFDGLVAVFTGTNLPHV
jgi:hypothetical protein